MPTTATQRAPHPLVGAIVRDTTVAGTQATYAIGREGFLCLADGTYLRYDSAFPGPTYFTAPAFEVIDVATVSVPGNG